MSFGLYNAPATFMMYMNSLFHEVLDECVVVYIDDILVFSKIEKQHIQDITKVLFKLCKYKLFVNAKKSEFFLQEL